MTWCVYLVAVFLVVTKLCDVASTLRKIAHPHEETNPIARHMMLGIGTSKAAALVMVLALAIIGICTVVALRAGPAAQSLFAISGTGIALVQAAVAHCNWTGRENAFTRHVRAMHLSLQRIMHK